MSGETVSEYPLDPAAAAELRRLIAEVLAELLPGLSRRQSRGQSAGQSRMNVPSIAEEAV